MINEFRQFEKLESLNVTVIEWDKTPKGFTTIVDGKKYIVVNPNLSDNDRYWVIEHELMHIMMNNFYDSSSDPKKIHQIEFFTNEFMAIENGLIEEVALMLSEGATKEQIKETLYINDEIYENVMMSIIHIVMKEV